MNEPQWWTVEFIDGKRDDYYGDVRLSVNVLRVDYSIPGTDRDDLTRWIPLSAIRYWHRKDGTD